MNGIYLLSFSCQLTSLALLRKTLLLLFIVSDIVFMAIYESTQSYLVLFEQHFERFVHHIMYFAQFLVKSIHIVSTARVVVAFHLPFNGSR